MKKIRHYSEQEAVMEGKMYKSDKQMQAIAHVVLGLMTLSSLLPFVLLVISSFTEENYATRYGFSFFPKAWSLGAYQYLMNEWNQIGHAYLITFIVTVLGTLIGMVCSTMLAYGLTRDIVGKAFLNFYVVFTMLFSGGIVASYYVWSNLFHIKNTIWALVLPGLLINAFNIILEKNYFNNNIPESLIESAKIDGAGDIKTFVSIVLPLSKPILATIGLMSAICYWNDWTNGLYYVDQAALYSLQQVLNNINENASFLASNSTQMSSMLHGTASIPTTTMRMAIAVIGILPMVIAYPFFQKYFVKGITIGAVKG